MTSEIKEIRWYLGKFKVKLIPCQYNELECPDDENMVPCRSFEALEDFTGRYKVEDWDENGRKDKLIWVETHYWKGRKGCASVTKLWRHPRK